MSRFGASPAGPTVPSLGSGTCGRARDWGRDVIIRDKESVLRPGVYKRLCYQGVWTIESKHQLQQPVLTKGAAVPIVNQLTLILSKTCVTLQKVSPDLIRKVNGLFRAMRASGARDLSVSKCTN